MRINIYMIGVGGQGLITTSNLIGAAATSRGIKVLTSETHGLSQRGGSVDVHVRLGDVNSPLIPLGGADLVIAFELLEAFRAAPYINENTKIIVNSRLIRPPTPRLRLPSAEELINKLNAIRNVKIIDAFNTAIKLGNPIVENMVLLGAAHAAGLNLAIDENAIIEAIKSTMRMPELNVKAFKMGIDLVNGSSPR
ncbi:indolepyruvate oxidoreductase [Thermocladium modestius]|uniref:Indolepyruvate oxidoreductase n=1 Tax=Thermocladium modestius TaxID=62609 RepID=A0A830GUL7_9CREN|nr:indolepyruvate oxidoreductase subunit beta [Thermocladium modestius]GGP20264.1 indolepyruvate oxidoreductase [Thermocladium modestius]